MQMQMSGESWIINQACFPTVAYFCETRRDETRKMAGINGASNGSAHKRMAYGPNGRILDKVPHPQLVFRSLTLTLTLFACAIFGVTQTRQIHTAFVCFKSLFWGPGRTCSHSMISAQVRKNDRFVDTPTICLPFVALSEFVCATAIE